MINRDKALVFGGIHFLMQVIAMILGFGTGELLFDALKTSTIKFLSSVLYYFIFVITFPVVYIVQKYQISGFGLLYFFLNSIIWATLFYYSLKLSGYIKSQKE
jgi:ABC-type transport system involved in cytochrome c biogenesis permease subunit